jgi:hypothetical protein
MKPLNIVCSLITLGLCLASASPGRAQESADPARYPVCIASRTILDPYQDVPLDTPSLEKIRRENQELQFDLQGIIDRGGWHIQRKLFHERVKQGTPGEIPAAVARLIAAARKLRADGTCDRVDLSEILGGHQHRQCGYETTEIDGKVSQAGWVCKTFCEWKKNKEICDLEEELR